MGNVFDQFDAPAPSAPPAGANVFDQFDAPRRGALGEIGTAFKRGVMVDVPNIAGKVLQSGELVGAEPGPISAYGKKLSAEAEARGAQPDYALEPEKHNAVTNALAGGAEMIPQVAAPVAAAALAPEGAVATGVAAAAGAVPFALAAGRETLDKARAKGVSEDEALTAARENALAQGALMTAGGAVTGKIVGTGGKVLSSLTRGGESAGGRALADAADTSILKPALAAIPASAASNTAMLAGQGAAGAAIERAHGVDTQSPSEAALETIPSSLGMTALLAPFGFAGAARLSLRKQKVVDTLRDPEADPGARLNAAMEIHSALQGDPGAAQHWDVNAADAITSKKPIELDDSFIAGRKDFTESGKPAEGAPAPGEYVPPEPIPEDTPPLSTVDPSRGPLSAAAAISEHVTLPAFPFSSEEAARTSLQGRGEPPEGWAFAVQRHPSVVNRWAVTLKQLEKESENARPVEGGAGSADRGAGGEGDATANGGVLAPDVSGAKAGGEEAPHIDTLAHAAATSPLSERPEPTEAQKVAGNYAKGHLDVHGLDVSIENPAGSIRKGADWEQVMHDHYGYIRGTVGRDKDHIDAFIGPNPASTRAFVVDQVDPKTGKFDEHKVILGANSIKEAREIYSRNYSADWKGLGAIRPTTIDGLKTWFKEGDTTKPFADQAKGELRAAETGKGSEGRVEQHQGIDEGVQRRGKDRSKPPSLVEKGAEASGRDRPEHRQTLGEVAAAARTARERGPTDTKDAIMELDRAQEAARQAGIPQEHVIQAAEAARPRAPSLAVRRLAETRATLESHFTPGNIVKGYGGMDRVLGFDWNNGEWRARVEEVKKRDGKWEAVGTPRVHATMPGKRNEVIQRAVAKPVEEPVATAPSKQEALFKREEGVGVPLEREHTESITKRLGIAAKVADTEADLPAHLRDQIKAEKAEGEIEGAFDSKTGDVWLVRSNLHTEARAMSVALHESAHRGLVKLFGEDLKPILDHIFNTNESVQNLARATMGKYGYDQARATEEVLADMALRGHAKTLKGWESFVEFLRDWLVKRGFDLKVTDEMAEYIAGAAAHAGKEEALPASKEEPARLARTGKENIDRLDRAQQFVKDMVERIRTGTQRSDLGVMLTRTVPNALQAAGVPNHPLYLPGNVALKAVGRDQASQKHGWTQHEQGLLSRVVNDIFEPVMIFGSATRDDSVMLLTREVDAQGAPIVVTVLRRGTLGRADTTVITSIYPRQNAQHMFETWAREGKLLYYDRGKVAEMEAAAPSTTSRLQLPSVVQLGTTAGHTLLSDEHVVNRYGAMFSRGPAAVESPAKTAPPSGLFGVAAKLKEGLSDETRQRDIARGGFRSAMATMDRAIGTTDAALEKARTAVDAIPPQQRWDAMYQYQTGGVKAVADPKLRPIFEAWKTNVDERARKIQNWDEGYLKEVLPNYFSQMWKDPTKALEFYQRMMGKGPLEGGKSFLKRRAYATYKEGMSWKVYGDGGGMRFFATEKDARAAAGAGDVVKPPLEPISNNFVDIAQLSLQQMDKFIAMHEYRQWLKEEKGWVKSVKQGDPRPTGYAVVDDPAFRTRHAFPVIDEETGKPAAAIVGYDYMVPEFIAKDLNNYLSKGFGQFGLWRSFRYAQNLMLSARLGFSAFHAGFTTMDTLVSHTDVGARYLLQGDTGKALATWGKAITSPISAPLEGRRLLKQFFGQAAADANTAAVLSFLTEGGARGRMHATDFNNSWVALRRAWSAGDIKSTALQALPAVMEGIMRPIMHHLVPWQKMTARVLLAKFELDRVAAQLGKEKGDYAAIVKAMGEDAMRQVAYKVVQQVDDRLGQVAYDNLFWNKFAKDVAQASIQSVGWNVGTANVILGGAKDVTRLFKPEQLLGPLDKAGKVQGQLGRVTGRLSYLISLNLTVGMMGAALNYALTGEEAKDMRDYFFPRTGRKNPDGSDERISMPSYIKDEYALSQHPVTTVQHKLHPFFSMVAELLKNEDFYGNQIVNPDDPWTKIAKQAMTYLGKSVEPYAVQNLQQNRSKGETGPMSAAPFIGITPAPSSVSRTPFEAYITERYAQSYHQSLTPESAEKAQARREAISAMKAGKQPDLTQFTPQERMSIFTAARTPIQQQRFNRLSLQEKISAWERATPEERAKFNLKGALVRDFSQHQLHLDPVDRAKVMDIIRAG